MRVRVLPEARAEAREARRWLREHASARQAVAFEQELRAALRQVSDFPESASRQTSGTRRLLLREFLYSIIYRVEPDMVTVFAVAHASRRPGYWRGWLAP
jgi:plasmid stabilization system protein ParE